MPLKYPAEWKYEGFPHPVPDSVQNEFIKLISLMVEGVDQPKGIYEDFKSAYGASSTSSSTSFAEGDMIMAMRGAKENAARYVASFYTGMESVARRGIAIPSFRTLNRILAENEVPLIINPPNLILKEGDIAFVLEDSSMETPMASFIRGPEIGRGGFGGVYLVTRKTKIGEYRYAMKLLQPSSFITNKERARQRFEREMAILGKLQHRGIVALLEAGLDAEQTPYILMPYIDGKDIRTALSGAQPKKVAGAFIEVLNALGFAHKNEVIHRDLKPKNIMVRTADEQPLILDFGCAYLLDEVDDSLTTTMIGSSAYIPIEVHQDPKHRDIRQDIYACGVMLYEVIAQRLPKPDDYEPLEPKFPSWAGIDKVIQAALAPERKRIESAKEFRNRLADLQLDT